MLRSFLFIGLGLTVSFSSWAQVEHTLVRRITVFPVMADKEYAKAAEEAWWGVREILTENQRFLVASRNFLIQRDVYQPRAELKPADAVILGKLLDANALITTFLNERVLSMRVYEGEYGRLLWSHNYNLHPSLPVSDQMLSAAKKLIYDFIASIPYQGFVILDPLNGGPTYKQGTHVLAKVNVGGSSHAEIGDSVQFIHLYHDTIKPLFTPDTEIEIFAEGRVVSVEQGILTVEVHRSIGSSPIKEFTLIRLPKELQRLRDSYALHPNIGGRVGTEYFSPEITPVQQQIAEKKPLVTALVFVANLATFLLLAF